MKKTKILFILLLSLSSLFIACDKGEDSVDFAYSQDSKDPRIFYFQASGSSDYGDFDYRWDFGKGNTASGSSASHQFDTYGNHVVTLYADIDKSGIHSTVSKKIEIDIPKITNVDFSYTTSSTNPKEYYFTATGESNYGTVDFEWDFGQNNIETGERATAEFGEYGFNDVTLTASIKNLGDDVEAVSTSKTIEVLAPEFKDLDFTYSQNSEDGRILYLKANSKVTYGTVDYKWNFGNGQGQSGEETSYTFDSYGKKTIQLTGTIKETGVSTTRTMTVDVQPPVFKNFAINYEVSNSNPLTIFLTATAESEQGGTLSYQWNLGQGIIYTGQNITHTFDSYGEKTITVTVKNADADIEDTKTEIITLDTPVIKDLAYTYKRDQKNPLKAYFTASSNSDYDITYEWDFGDGEIRVGRMVEIDYTGFGLKNVVLKASVANLNISSKIEDTFMFDAPTITELDFEYVFDKKNNYNAYFTSNGKCDYGELEYKWDFGFGNIFTGSNLNYSFKYYDSYPISLIATIKGTNISKTITKSIEVKEPTFDNFDFTYEIDENNPLLVYFYGTGTTTQGTVNFEWSFGKGDYDTGKDANHQFDSFGKKTVYLTAKNTTMNVTDTISKEIELTAPEIKNLKFDFVRNKYEALKATFTASSTSEYDVTYEWDFGDGKIKTGKVIDVSFDDFGMKNVTLKAIIKDLGIESEHIKEIELTEPQIKNFNVTYTNDPKNKLKKYFVTSAEVDYGELEFEWDFGNGNIKEGSNVNMTFDYFAEYPVSVKATVVGTRYSQKNNSLVLKLDDNISDINFNFEYIDNNDTDGDFLKATFKSDLSALDDLNLSNIKYEWNFDDTDSGLNNTATGESPIHQFTKTNLYRVQLCIDAAQLIEKKCITKDVPIIERPTKSITDLRGEYQYQVDGTDTWWRSVHINNIYSNLYETTRVELKSYFHIGCYAADDKNYNQTIIANDYAGETKFADESCWAENSPNMSQTVTYYLLGNTKYSKSMNF